MQCPLPRAALALTQRTELVTGLIPIARCTASSGPIQPYLAQCNMGDRQMKPGRECVLRRTVADRHRMAQSHLDPAYESRGVLRKHIVMTAYSE
jgi:hypothetical protein